MAKRVIATVGARVRFLLKQESTDPCRGTSTLAKVGDIGEVVEVDDDQALIRVNNCRIWCNRYEFEIVNLLERLAIEVQDAERRDATR